MKVALQFGLAWPDIPDLFEVRFSGCRIGRLWLAHAGGTPGRPWEWLLSLPMELPETTKGASATMEGALDALARQWGRLVAHTQAERLQRALELGLAVERKEQSASADVRSALFEHTIELTAADLEREPRVAAVAPPVPAPATGSGPHPPMTPQAPATPSRQLVADMATVAAPGAMPAQAPADPTPVPAVPIAARSQPIPAPVAQNVVVQAASQRRVFRIKTGTKPSEPATRQVGQRIVQRRVTPETAPMQHSSADVEKALAGEVPAPR